MEHEGLTKIVDTAIKFSPDLGYAKGYFKGLYKGAVGALVVVSAAKAGYEYYKKHKEKEKHSI